MPRQLPWVNKGARSRVQVKKPPAKKQRISAEDDDDFFNGTILESSISKTTRAGEPDDDLGDLPAEPSTPRTKRMSRNGFYQEREQSSSPPIAQDFEEVKVEQMRKGVSTFDLRDDEWMMVEDELLETAKLFTRHLHIAEYERLKEKIEAKKKEAEASRPVIADARMSVDGAMKIKAKEQERKQKKAIRDVFASQDDDDGIHSALPRTNLTKAKPTLNGSNRMATSASRSAVASSTLNNSDSEDLDTLHPTSTKPKSFTKPSTERTTDNPPSPTLTRVEKVYSAFAKPTLPSSKTATTKVPRPSRSNRATPFDMLDDYKSPSTSTTPAPQLHRAQTTTSTTTSRLLSSFPPSTTYIKPEPRRSGTSAPSLDDWGSNSTVSKETAERLAKRRAEREKEDKEKSKRADRKSVQSDEIPTFLF